MEIVGMTYGRPGLGEHPFVLEQRSRLKGLTERRQVEATALQNLQRESTKGLAPGAPLPQALAVQLRAQQQRVVSLDVAAALIAGGMPKRIGA
ncbi:hypothetical protein [Massilia sp. YMA4]|uniref:hypothetical protein n=1 Tax=Massilia sp. YMA4 TaxID=1593482 RepID=UPI001582B22F|nr:hypothetical protein [Massilia sp. YMA4]